MMSCTFDDLRRLPNAICALLALAMLLVAACGGSDDDTGGTIEHPSRAGDVILRIEELDVFSPLGDATEVPLLTLYGDGTLIVLDRQADATATGLPALERYLLNEEGIQYILGEAESAGLLDGDERFAGPYQDVPVTRFTATAAGATSITRVDGLHLTDPADIPEGEREDRERLSELATLAFSRGVWLTDERLLEAGTAFDAERLQVVSLPDDTPAQPADPIWPLETSLVDLRAEGSSFGFDEATRCFELTGMDARQFTSALAELGSSGRAGTTWQSDDQLFDIYARPLLPDQAACA